MSDTTTRCTFTRDSLTIDGITRPAEYSVTPAGTVFVFVAVDVDGQERKVRIKIPADDPRYAAALAAAPVHTAGELACLVHAVHGGSGTVSDHDGVACICRGGDMTLIVGSGNDLALFHF